MMRTATITATRIALLLIFIQAAIGFTNGIGLFQHDFIKTPVNDYTTYTIQDVSKYKPAMGIGGTWATLVQISQAFLDGLPLAGQVLFAPLIIFPVLIDAFQIDSILSGFIQLGVWAVYSLAIAEILTGRQFIW